MRLGMPGDVLSMSDATALSPMLLRIPPILPLRRSARGRKTSIGAQGFTKIKGEKEMTICGSCTLCEYYIDVMFGKKYKLDELCEYFDGIGCMIHKHRPLCCRVYPFDFLFLENKVLLFVDKKCPEYLSFLEDKTFRRKVSKYVKRINGKSWNKLPLIADAYVGEMIIPPRRPKANQLRYSF
jgi:Fe-S-cluster containining protein